MKIMMQLTCMYLNQLTGRRTFNSVHASVQKRTDDCSGKLTEIYSHTIEFSITGSKIHEE